MAKGEVFRGYRPVPVAIAGVIGLLAAWLQPRVVPADDDGKVFLAYWLSVAALNMAVIGGVIAVGWRRSRDSLRAPPHAPGGRAVRAVPRSPGRR